MRFAALNTGSDFHLLDHIAPLAALMEMPLLVNEERNADLARRYYPFVSVLYEPDLGSQLASLAERFDVLFECKYWPIHLPLLFRDLFKKEMRLVFCPHGQSDKGFAAPLLAPYSYQDMVLLYGDLLIEMLQGLNLWPLPHFTITGNYRLAYYLRHRAFYDALAEKEIFSRFDRSNPILLYAPTWQDADNASSFFDFVPRLFSELPSDYNLLIKVHPLLEQRDPARFYSLADQKSNVLLISDFPPVYPLLSRASALIGDFSSVGYDSLAFQRPLYFFPNSRLPAGKLRKCGEILDPSSPFSFLEHLEKKKDFEEHDRLYRFAFGPPRSLEEVKCSIVEALTTRR